MAEEEQNASIRATVVKTTEETFKPPAIFEMPETVDEFIEGESINAGNAVKQIFAVLEPNVREENTYYDPEYLSFYDYILPPAISSYQKLPEFTADKKELIINIETTGTKPWESRIICIGVMDPNEAKPVTMNFINETEQETLQEFVEWLKTTPYDTLIGYNVSFDHRFIYVAMQKYRFELATWRKMKLFDLMQQQKQVKDSFVYGRNPEGKLQDWSTYLFDLPEYAPQKQVFAWFKEKNLDEIANFNSDKIVKSYFLYVLGKLVDGQIPGAEIIARQSTPETTTETTPLQEATNNRAENIDVQCTNCLQKQTMLKTAKTKPCDVCGTTIVNPNL